jgi:3-carboxy-cis,cis-muconate cycloisomerase
VTFDAATLDRGALLAGARSAGVPVVALVELLHAQAGPAAERVHRGATSQDILDTALVLISRDALTRARASLASAGAQLATRAQEHRQTPFVARTLTQEAEATTLGAVMAGWLDAVSSAVAALDAVAFPVQLGGAVGTGAAFVRASGRPDAPRLLRASLAAGLGLADPGRSWHTDRSPVLAIAAAAAQVVVSAGRIGRDLALAARDGVITPAHGGGSSAMPHKHNPVDAVLLSASGLRAGGLLSTLHAAALSSDARPAGEWHAEWQAWRGLLRLAAESSAVLVRAVGDLVVTAPEASPAATPAGSSTAEATLEAAGAVVDAAIARFATVTEAHA